jgi:hypothetical protein
VAQDDLYPALTGFVLKQSSPTCSELALLVILYWFPARFAKIRCQLCAMGTLCPVASSSPCSQDIPYTFRRTLWV